MQRVIKVRGRTGKFITPSFLYTDNEPLVIKFDVADHRVGKYVAQVVCGEQKKTVYLGKDMSVEVLPDFIKAGEFNPIHIFLEFRTQYGDKVVIRPQPTANNGQIVVARIGDEATVKRLSRQNGQVWLLPENPNYDPIDGSEAEIVGIVKAVVREY